MRRLPVCSVLLIAVLVVPFGGVSEAAPMLDQSYEASNTNANGFIYKPGGGPIDRAQTFTVGLTGLLTQVNLLDFGVFSGVTLPLLFDIRTTSGGVPTESNSGANILASLSIGPGGIPSAPASGAAPTGTLAIDLSSLGLFVTLGDVLGIALRTEDTTEGAYRWGREAVNGYAGGADFIRLSGTWGPNSTSPGDQSFQTFVDPNPVPAPSAMLLMGTGLFGLVGWRWWKD